MHTLCNNINEIYIIWYSTQYVVRLAGSIGRVLERISKGRGLESYV